MQTQEPNDEQSPNSVNSRVMGKSNTPQTDSSSNKPAESLKMTDLQADSVDQQLQQELKHLSLTEQLEKEDVNSDRWDSMLDAVQQSLIRLESSLTPAIARIEKLEHQQDEFSKSSTANASSLSEQSDKSNSSTVQPENSLKQVTDAMIQLTEMHKSLFEQHSTSMMQNYANKDNRKRSSSTEFYKASWKYKHAFDPDKISFPDWRILLRNELVEIRDSGIYWNQLTGNIERRNLSAEQAEHWSKRSQQMLSCLLHSFKDTDLFDKIKDVEVVTMGDSLSGAELAWKILCKTAFNISKADEQQLIFEITALKMTEGCTFSQYVDYGTHYEAELARCPHVVMFEYLVTRWVNGICSEWEVHKVQLRYEIGKLNETGDPYKLEQVMTRFQQIVTEAGKYIQSKKIMIKGRDVSAELGVMSNGLSHINSSGTQILSATTETDKKKVEPYIKKKYDGDPCENKHCEQRDSHGTNYCTAYGGPREGKWRHDWSPKYREKLQLQLNKKIAKLGQSEVSKKAGVDTNSSSVQQKRTYAERNALLEQLLNEKEEDDRAIAKATETYQQLDNEGY